MYLHIPTPTISAENWKGNKIDAVPRFVNHNEYYDRTGEGDVRGKNEAGGWVYLLNGKETSLWKKCHWIWKPKAEGMRVS